MFTKENVQLTGVSGGAIRSQHVQGQKQVVSGKRQLTADSHSVSTVNGLQSQYNYMMTGILPADPRNTDTTSLGWFYRDCYLLDSTAGSAVDIQSVFPFSDWELTGLTSEKLRPYNEVCEQLSLRQLMPVVSTAYLADGFFAGSLIYDPKSKGFMDTLVHDALQCVVHHSPFFNVDPAITVNLGAVVQQFLASQSPYAKSYVNKLPRDFRDTLRQGSFVLDPVSTLFVARRGLTDRPYTSYLHRVLPMYLIEKTLFRGTLVEATKRQRAMSHIMCGDDLWTPSNEELMDYVRMFQEAEKDPLGGWVATRNAVQINDLRPAGDFLKWTDMADIMVAYKLRALGISEALLSGDASFAAAESAYSTFLETCNGYRNHLTSQVFYRRVFPLVAVVNGFYKDASKAKSTQNPLDFLYNATNSGNLEIPTLKWHKSLEAKTEDSVFDMLDKASEKGVPIPMKMWMAAANIDSDTLLRDLREDKSLTEQLNSMKGKVEEQDPSEAGFDSELESHLARLTSNRLPSELMSANPAVGRVGLGGRTFGSHELFETTRTGKQKHVYNQQAKIHDINGRIAKIAIRAQKDPEYRRALRNANAAKGVKTTLDL